MILGHGTDWVHVHCVVFFAVLKNCVTAREPCRLFVTSFFTITIDAYVITHAADRESKFTSLLVVVLVLVLHVLVGLGIGSRLDLYKLNKNAKT